LDVLEEVLMEKHMAYQADPSAKSLATNVLRVFEENGRCCAILEDSIFFPEGGGQPGDLGRVGSANLLEVAWRQGEAVHVCDSTLEGGPIVLTLDWARRYDHMQQHTGQHLLTAVARARFGWATLAFHLGPDLCDIELDAPMITPQQRLELEDAAIEEIVAGRSVSARWVTREDFDKLSARSRGLPEGHDGDVRLVEIDGLDINACGGTHLASTSELECVKLIGTESIRGGTRLFFVFGKRLRNRLEAHEQRAHQLRTILGRPDDALVAAVEQRIAHEKELDRAQRLSDGELAAAYAKLALPQVAGGVLISRHFENKDADFLQKFSRALLDADNSRLVFATAEKGGASFFSLAAGSACQADVPALGRQAAALLGGKGGGSGKQFQGKFADSALAGKAAEELAKALGQV
jgi:Ser-tRNA(Ala) deacylase AlaX